MTPFKAYQTYLALKTHFTSASYDYHRYRGNMNLKEDTFEMRKDKYFFYKLSKKENPEGFVLANFTRNGIKWIGELLDANGEDAYDSWKKVKESLAYTFKSELNTIDMSFDDMVFVPANGYPVLLQKYLDKQVSIETLTIVQDCCNIVPYWNGLISEYDPIWKETRTMIRKYSKFLEYDRSKMQEIIAGLAV